MNGVEILSSETIYETTSYPWIIAIIAGLGFLGGLIIAIVHWIDYGFDGDDILTIIGCTVIGAYLGFFGCIFSERDTDTIDHIEYKVTIDDSVSMNEFLDKYEIINQEGKIYTVKEK